MGARWLAEASVNLIQTAIQTNIASALSSVATQRGDAAVVVEPPEGYYIYDKPKGYRCPAIIILTGDMDFRTSEKESNFVNAKIPVYVGVVVEAVSRTDLTIKCYRYISAIFSVLDNAVLTTSDSIARLVVVVKKARKSVQYSVDTSAEDASFRQEIMLECDVEHYEG